MRAAQAAASSGVAMGFAGGAGLAAGAANSADGAAFAGVAAGAAGFSCAAGTSFVGSESLTPESFDDDHTRVDANRRSVVVNSDDLDSLALPWMREPGRHGHADKLASGL